MHLQTRLMALLLALLCCEGAHSQLKADFTTDTTSGCSPLTVSFNNTTAGASASATFLWELGNGNTSDERNVKAVYTVARTYTVRLTVRDGGQQSTKSMELTVYRNPEPSFTATPVKGCAPTEVRFASTSKPGDGTIRNYFWDFGDGTTGNGANKDTLSHTYNFAQTPPVKLTVTNSFGCFATVERNGLINILPPIRIGFTADKTIHCAVPATSVFSTNTTGPGTLSYAWDFGNGVTATERTPAAVNYTQKGLYTVKLKVTSSEGCVDSLVQRNYINAANFNTRFSLPDQLCVGAPINFTGSSQPQPQGSRWRFGDGSETSGSNVVYSYRAAGTYTVQLINTYGSCTDTASKTAVIQPAPVLNGFITDKTGACTAPLTVNFEDSSSSTRRLWEFGTGNPADTANGKQAAFTYNRLGDFIASLTVFSEGGCRTTVRQNIRIQRPGVNINILRSTGQQGGFGCPGMKVQFGATPTGAVKTYRWDFGDGGTSNEAQPEYTFAREGFFTIKLVYTTEAGCTDSVSVVNMVRAYRKPKTDFGSLSGLNICGNTPVRFRDRSDTATSWRWDFGDGNWSSLQHPVHSYGRSGQFTVRLIATNQFCSDTLERPQFITLAPPFPDITGFRRTCANRGQITFAQSSQGATKWTWDFGDGTPTETYTTNLPEVSHTYRRSGVYRAVLYATNDTCTTLDTLHVSVMLPQQPVLTVNKDKLCGSDTLTFSVRGLDTIKYYSFWTQRAEPYPYTGRVVYGNGQLHSNNSQSWYPPEYRQLLTNFRPGMDSLRVITYDGIHGCFDTSNFVKLQVSGPVAGFQFANRVYCAGSDIQITDTSKGTAGVPIKQWVWDFGNGSRSTRDTGGTFALRYDAAGQFFTRLRVVDANGCTADATNGGQWITTYGPDANFFTNDSVVAPGTPVRFTNTTNRWPFFPVNYSWNFGDGSAGSTQEHPVHTYARSGTYTVTLIARSTSGCTDTLVRRAYVSVKTVRASFAFTAGYVNNNNCPPLQARFRSNAVNADSLFWVFGNSGTAVNRQTPEATYYQPGVYRVTLYAYGQGTVDSVTQELTVNGPFGSVKPSELIGCSPKPITLAGTVRNATRITWDFNDGYVAQGADTLASHTYTKPGVYHPKVILRDTAGCTSTILLEDSIIIDRLQQRITPSPTLVCDSGWVTLATNRTSFAQDSLKQQLEHRWNFGTGNAGDTSRIANPRFNFNVLGTYPLTLHTRSPFGCEQTSTDTIRVLPKPKARISAVQSICVQQTLLVRDTASRNPGESWRWQLGSGRSSEKDNPDPFSFEQPGRYTLQLIKNSTNGCADTAAHLVLADKLELAPGADRRLLCDSGSVQFTPSVRSYARDSLGTALSYRWRFGTPDSSTSMAPQYRFVSPGLYTIRATVNSPLGCTATIQDSIRVLTTPAVAISGNVAVCAGTPVQIGGTINISEQTVWAWDVAGTRTNQQVPPSQTFNRAGSYPARLVAYNHPACPDTVSTTIVVNPLPQPALTPGDTLLCRGDSITLRARDAVQYAWTLNGTSAAGTGAQLRVSPAQDARYRVTAVNQWGCRAEDSLSVRVSQPFTIKASADRTTICANWTTNLQVSGATRYQWLQGSLNNSTSDRPVARPGVTTTYTVVGYGSDQCFTDTATVHIEVIPLPQLKINNDTMVYWGSTVPLRAQTSADVTRVVWTPASYLSCTVCPDPVSVPDKPVIYRAVARNSFGCIAADTVTINLLCSESSVHIPNAFTPDGDGRNDVFYIKGGGISVIRYFRIFNRWGDLVFEKNNIAINDRNTAWDGTLNGLPLPPENYIYITEMVCEGNRVYQRKGTVALIR